MHVLFSTLSRRTGSREWILWFLGSIYWSGSMVKNLERGLLRDRDEKFWERGMWIDFSKWVRGLKVKVAQLCLTLCDPMDCNPPGSSVMGFSKQEYWGGLPCPPPGDLPHPGTEPLSLLSPTLAGGFFTTSATGKPIYTPSYMRWLMRTYCTVQGAPVMLRGNLNGKGIQGRGCSGFTSLYSRN